MSHPRSVGLAPTRRTSSYQEKFFDTAIADLLRSLTLESATSRWLDAQMGAPHAREVAQTEGEAQRLRHQKAGLERLHQDAYLNHASGKIDERLRRKLNTRWEAELDEIELQIETILFC